MLPPLVIPALVLGLSGCGGEDAAERIVQEASRKSAASIAEKRQIEDPRQRAGALARAASARAYITDDALVDEAFETAHHAALQVPPDDRSEALSRVYAYMQLADRDLRAVDYAESHPADETRSELLAGIARRMAEDQDREALRVLESAERAARGITDPILRGDALVRIARVRVDRGSLERGLALLGEAEAAALALEDYTATPTPGVYGRGSAWALCDSLVYAYALAGRSGRAKSFIAGLPDPELRARLLGNLKRYRSRLEAGE